MKASGMALVEALVAASLLGLGLLGASRLTVTALTSAQQTREQEHAIALAREALDCAVARKQPCPQASPVDRQGTHYRIELEQSPIGPQLTQVTALVFWQGAAGPQTLRWSTRVSELPDWLGLSLP